MRHLDAALPSRQRIVTLDVVRGFALLGILIMNMPGFANSFFIEADGSHLWSAPIDRAAELAREMLFSGKFNSMFSLLFGIGFTIQFARMQQLAPGHATQLLPATAASFFSPSACCTQWSSGPATCCMSTRSSACLLLVLRREP